MAGRSGGPTDTTEAENVLILGLRRSGKSSMVEVVYKSLSPDDSLFLESTSKCQSLFVNTFQPVRVWDGTGNFDNKQGSMQRDDNRGDGGGSGGAGPSSSSTNDARGEAAWCTGGQLYWTECAAVIFVIDSQDDIYDAIDRLNDVVVDAYAFNPLIHFHVFVHKVDGHSVDYRYDTLHTIQTRVADNLADASGSFIFAPTAHQILASEQAAAAASSKGADRGLADGGDSGLDDARAVGYDGGSSSLSASGHHTLSVTNPDLERDVRLSFHTTSIYNSSIFVAFSRVQIGLMNDNVAKTLESICNGLSNSCKFEKVYLFDVPTKTYIAADSSPFDENNFDAISEYLHFLVQFSGLYCTLGKVEGKENEGQSETRYSASTARLSPDTTLGVHQINHHLALAFALRTDIHTKHTGMIDFNIAVARKSIRDVYAVCHE